MDEGGIEPFKHRRVKPAFFIPMTLELKPTKKIIKKPDLFILIRLKAL